MDIILWSIFFQFCTCYWADCKSINQIKMNSALGESGSYGPVKSFHHDHFSADIFILFWKKDPKNFEKKKRVSETENYKGKRYDLSQVRLKDRWCNCKFSTKKKKKNVGLIWGSQWHKEAQSPIKIFMCLPTFWSFQ